MMNTPCNIYLRLWPKLNLKIYRRCQQWILLNNQVSPTLHKKCVLARFYSHAVNGNYTHDSTIFSLSSGHGKCGVAVVRVSGPATWSVLQNIAQFKEKPAPRLALVRKLVNPNTRIVIDKGLVLYFQGPHSFTGEDSAEFQVHGGPAVVAALLGALHGVPGCRQALPGEFTKRAFQNAKLDLTEVEGLGDLIHAETEVQRRQALRQMEGDLGHLYQQWRTDIIKSVADLEAFIDFSEDQDIEDEVVQQVHARVGKLNDEIARHLDDKRQGERLREGVHVAIIGEPNVGKSSLLNAICQRPAAIVNDVAGTTRDVIETHVSLGGYPVLLSDTAGLRETEDKVEKEGVRRALQRAQQADVKVLVFDISRLQGQREPLRNMYQFIQHEIETLGLNDFNKEEHPDNVFDVRTKSKKNERVSYSSSFLKDYIIVFNKLDIVEEINIQNIIGQSKERSVQTNTVEADEQHGNGVPIVTEGDLTTYCISCTSGKGMDALVTALTRKVEQMCGNPLSGHPSLTQARHRAHLTACVAHLDHFRSGRPGGDIVLQSESLRRALREIGKLTGRITTEDILDVIFHDFCIGK
ncbi:tRNA modification GTPase GTPBP3, mitochondrial-like [Mya arenaria]|uniref:tRNA modification GTPase GTPBP3, mitochondrial-like n=1 Tax=Mya arenaria TaxID=6604 RepID=UPI0022E406C4|nr:tRNA modification GTPase GTPBP3, mitochondrial-like [Mya arenaria]